MNRRLFRKKDFFGLLRKLNKNRHKKYL